jgi:fructokinase
MGYGKTADKAYHRCSPLIFGEVLFDCFPDGREQLGGAPFNVAWNLQALGMFPVLVSRIGDDQLGRQIQKKMTSWDMTVNYLQIDPFYPTGKVQIELSNGEPKFTIFPDQAYDFITRPNPKMPYVPSFLYHGSLTLRKDVSRTTLSFLKQDYRCPVFVDVNLRSPWWDAEHVLDFIADATWLKLNEVELDSLFPGQENLEQRCRQLLDRFNLQAVFVTLGKRGAVALHRNALFCSVKPKGNISIMDTVGAGDAFSSVLLLGLMNDWSLHITMQRAQEFASAVVGQRGAISQDNEFYQTFRNKWKLQ